MAIFVPRFLRQLRDVLISSPADGEVIAYDDADGKWKNAAGGAGGGAPDDATYLVTTAQAGLSAEIVVGATPGGELGGTWASPTVDATHSGSSHAATQTAAEATAAAALAAHLLSDVVDGDVAGGVLSGTYPNPSFSADMATQAELNAHDTDTTSVHGIADTSLVSTVLWEDVGTSGGGAFVPKVGSYECGPADVVGAGGYVEAAWTYGSGDVLLDLTNPTAPTVVEAGLYLIQARQFLVSAQQAGAYMALELAGDSGGYGWIVSEQSPLFAPAVLGTPRMLLPGMMTLPAGADLVLYKENGGALSATLDADARIFYFGPSTIL